MLERIILCHFSAGTTVIHFDTAQLSDLLNALRNTVLPICILGEGSNVLFQGDYAGCVVVNQLKGRQILRQDNDHVWLSVAAGENWHECVMWCNDHGFYGQKT